MAAKYKELSKRGNIKLSVKNSEYTLKKSPKVINKYIL